MRGGNFTFAQVPIADIPRSSFDRSFSHKTTFDAGYLVPVFCDEVLPGDTFQVKASIFARLSTPIVPIMDNMWMDAFFFFVPNRLLWNDWQHFMGEQDNPGDSTDFVVPILDLAAANIASGTLYDYFGCPVGYAGLTVSALYGRAYNLIWNEWFRDENLQTRVPFVKTAGPDAVTNYVLLRRGKRHDYFTSCLPWPQKGAGVTLPLGTSAPIVSAQSGSAANSMNIKYYGVTSGQTGITRSAAATTTPGMSLLSDNIAYASNEQIRAYIQAGTVPQLTADLTNATAATINSLRQAFQIQRLLERDARGGTRYIELLRSHFGVVSPDARLQRPEFLGGGTVPIVINPVAQTSSTDATTPQGHLAAFGIAGGSGIGFSKSFVEHGIVIGMVCVRADLSYQQGLHKQFSRRTRYDFYWPSFAHLGEQAVLNQEIYATANTTQNAQVFGYQERWAEYRYAQSLITGKFRSTVAQPLDVWHLAQNFTALPTLGATFIQETPPVSRIVAVTTEPQFIFDSHWKVRATRPMPTYSVPGLIDHF